MFDVQHITAGGCGGRGRGVVGGGEQQQRVVASSGGCISGQLTGLVSPVQPHSFAPCIIRHTTAEHQTHKPDSPLTLLVFLVLVFLLGYTACPAVLFRPPAALPLIQTNPHRTLTLAVSPSLPLALPLLATTTSTSIQQSHRQQQTSWTPCSLMMWPRSCGRVGSRDTCATGSCQVGWWGWGWW